MPPRIYKSPVRLGPDAMRHVILRKRPLTSRMTILLVCFQVLDVEHVSPDHLLINHFPDLERQFEEWTFGLLFRPWGRPHFSLCCVDIIFHWMLPSDRQMPPQPGHHNFGRPHANFSPSFILPPPLFRLRTFPILHVLGFLCEVGTECGDTNAADTGTAAYYCSDSDDDWDVRRPSTSSHCRYLLLWWVDVGVQCSCGERRRSEKVENISKWVEMQE